MELVEVTVNLTPRAMRAVELVALAGGTRTDAINRLIIAGGELYDLMAQGDVILVRRDGTRQQIRLH